METAESEVGKLAIRWNAAVRKRKPEEAQRGSLGRGTSDLGGGPLAVWRCVGAVDSLLPPACLKPEDRCPESARPRTTPGPPPCR